MKKLKIGKESIKTILSYEWPIFLLVPFISSVLFSYLFHLADKPKDYEKIRFFSGFDISNDIHDKLANEYLDSFKDYGILQTTFYNLSETDLNYTLNFGNVTFNNYEVIISSENEYNKDASIFNNCSITLDTNYFSSEFDFLYYEGNPIAVKIYDGNDASYNDKFTFKNNMVLTSTAYAFASSKSVNASKIIDGSHSLNETALKIFTDLFL